MNVERVNLRSNYEKEEIRTFLKKFGLEYAEDVDYTAAIRRGDEIIGTASKTANVVKCFAVDDSARGEGVTNLLVTSLTNKMFEEGITHSFLFTKPENIDIFGGIGYKLIAKTGKVALMEMGIGSIDKKIDSIKKNFNIEGEKERGLIVMNCNPFTFGHQYLIETAASQVEELLIFVVEEDKSVFPFRDRYELVKKGTGHLPNVKVIPGTEYIISSATFPTYFLKKEDDMLLEYVKLDVTVTAEHFCKKLGIKKRFVGEEPYCQVTARYNDAMKAILPDYGVELIQIPRKEWDGKAISASRVREYIKNDKLEELKELVPGTTYEYLLSDAGQAVCEKIKNV